MTKNRKPYGPLYQKALKKHARTLGLKGSALAVLNVFADCINGETGQARPGRKHLMEESGIMSDRTLDKALKILRDTEIIRPIAYFTGGRGRATVYGFCLPAWSGQARAETPAENAADMSRLNAENPRKNFTKPPQNIPQTPAENAAPTERTERTEGSAADGAACNDTPSRREGDKVPDPIEEEYNRLLTVFLRTMGYGEAKREADEWLSAQRATA